MSLNLDLIRPTWARRLVALTLLPVLMALLFPAYVAAGAIAYAHKHVAAIVPTFQVVWTGGA